MVNKTLVLSLDEVLLHWVPESPDCGDYEFWHRIGDKNHTITLFKRPFVDEFIEEMSKIYEIIFFSTDHEDYANPIINYIDSKRVAGGRLYKDSWVIKEGISIKTIK